MRCARVHEKQMQAGARRQTGIRRVVADRGETRQRAVETSANVRDEIARSRFHYDPPGCDAIEGSFVPIDPSIHRLLLRCDERVVITTSTSCGSEVICTVCVAHVACLDTDWIVSLNCISFALHCLPRRLCLRARAPAGRQAAELVRSLRSLVSISFSIWPPARSPSAVCRLPIERLGYVPQRTRAIALCFLSPSPSRGRSVPPRNLIQFHKHRHTTTTADGETQV